SFFDRCCSFMVFPPHSKTIKAPVTLKPVISCQALFWTTFNFSVICTFRFRSTAMVIQLKSISGFQNCFSAWSKNLNKHMQLLSRLNLRSHPHDNSPFLATATGGIAISAVTSLILE
ncbi:MAG: hypothetical protein ACOWW1_10985, partial [archaeon]